MCNRGWLIAQDRGFGSRHYWSWWRIPELEGAEVFLAVINNAKFNGGGFQKTETLPPFYLFDSA
jgi:hypothetical protein